MNNRSNTKQGKCRLICSYYFYVSRGTFARDRALAISLGNYQKNMPGYFLRHIFIGFYI